MAAVDVKVLRCGFCAPCAHVLPLRSRRSEVGGRSARFPVPTSDLRPPTLVGTIKAAIIVALTGIILARCSILEAGTLNSLRPNPFKATTSRAARQDAIRSIPLDKLDADARSKVTSVLSSSNIFRRLPVRVVQCDPDLYLFLVQHPDVVVGIWETLGLSQLTMRKIDRDTYRLADGDGTLGSVECLYRSHDTHVVYVEGRYDGPLFTTPVRGWAVLILKTGYVREPDGRYYITSRLDTFTHLEPGGVEFLTKTFQPLVGKAADSNFIQTVAFLGSLSRTAEVNHRGVARLAGRLHGVHSDARRELARLAEHIAQRSIRLTAHELPSRSAPAKTR